MRTLTITPDYPPFFVGGTTIHAYELNKFLTKRGFEPWVITFWEDPKTFQTELSIEEGVHIVRVPRPDPSNMGDYNHQFLFQNECIKKGLHWINGNHCQDFDLIVLHSYFLAEAAIYAKKLYNTPLVYHVHTLFSNFDQEAQNEKYKVIRDYEKRICMESKKVIAVSEYLKNLIHQKLKIDTSNTVVITKAVDLEKYDSVLYPQVNRDYKKIVYAGRISFEKGIEVLIKAFMNVKNTYQGNVMLFIIGSASDEQYLSSIKTLIKQSHLERNIMFLGFTNPDDIVIEYKSSDLTVVPSYAETFGKVAIEAMAAKVPVIVSDVGGLGPIITHGVNGLRFRAGDEMDLAEKIITILNDASFADQLKEAAYKEVKNKYQWEQILDQTIQTYFEVTKDEIIGNLPSSR